MVLLFVESTQSFGIDNDDRELFTFSLGVEDFLPDPESFGARINSRAHLKSFQILLLLNLSVQLIINLLIESLKKELVQKIGFSSSVLATYCDNTYFAFYLLQEFYGFTGYFKPCIFNVVLNEWDSDTAIVIIRFHLINYNRN